MEDDDLGNVESQASTVMRRGEASFEYSPHSFHYSPHSTSSGPLQINDERMQEWELPRSYPLNYRSIHPEYLPRRQQPPQPAQTCYLSNPAEEWPRDTEPTVQAQVKKQEMCVMLMNKVVLCLEIENPVQITVQGLIELILQDDQDLSLPTSARDIFCMWLMSSMLELQLTPKQKPFLIRQQWLNLLLKYTSATTKHLDKDEPELYLKRNVFYDKQDEMRICDMKILELLYEEAKYNILKGRYPCDIQDCDILAGIQARLELGPFNPQIHTAEFFRSRIRDYLPSYACKNRWAFLNVSAKPGPEHRLLDRYRGISANTTRFKLLKKYMEFCWALPYYGCAFFQGQIEKPIKGLAALLDHYDKKILVGINRDGIHMIDTDDSFVLLSMRFKNLSWDYAASCNSENFDCLPCLFIQFTIPGQITRETKLIQIFSRQANMMDRLISKFVDELKQRPSWSEDQVDNYISSAHEDGIVPVTTRRLSSEANMEERFKRLSLTTINESGKPVNYSKSWTFRK